MSDKQVNVNEGELLARASDLVQLEALLIDGADWDRWLDLYVDDCIFWVPAWRSDGHLVSNPRREISHIYSVGRQALEDRIYRIRSKHSVSSIPMQRTAHMLSPSRLISASTPQKVQVHTNWTSHVYFPRSKDTQTFFGYYIHDLVDSGQGWRISSKKVVVNNDYFRSVLDFYFV